MEMGDSCLQMNVEAGEAIRANHERVLMDVTNPSKELNIDGKPLTQKELVRVPVQYREYANVALMEIEHRLLGEPRAEPL